MKPTLLILAAGMASRYGSMKQIDGFGPHGETIIDYSIHDAIRAGFGKISFIIREEFWILSKRYSSLSLQAASRRITFFKTLT
jgi:CTP:molybdopterin cytidylyltransferase MocA